MIDLKTRAYFGIKRLGEFASDTTELFESMLTDGILDTSMIALIAPYGAGKTHLFRRVKQRIEQKGIGMIWIDVQDDASVIRSGSIMQALAMDLAERCGETPRRSAEARSRQVVRLLGQLTVQQKTRVTLIIEDAHRLDVVALDALKRLREKDFAGHSPLLSIVLVGWPQLDAKLERRRDLLTRLSRMHLIEQDGWMTLSERTDYLEAVYGDVIESETRERLAKLHTVPVELNKAVADGLAQARIAGYDRLDQRIVVPNLHDLWEMLQQAGIKMRDIDGAVDGIKLNKSSISDAINGRGPHVDVVNSAMQSLLARRKPANVTHIGGAA